LTKVAGSRQFAEGGGGKFLAISSSSLLRGSRDGSDAV
jgi:hypothetical protein